VELAVGCEEQLMCDECREIGEIYDREISALITRTSRFAHWLNDLNRIDAVKAREISDQDFVRTSLEQFATRAMQCDTAAAKEYKCIFESLLTYNRL
jgi:hypothetical protein